MFHSGFHGTGWEAFFVTNPTATLAVGVVIIDPRLIADKGREVLNNYCKMVTSAWKCSSPKLILS
jgi:hypothetical protein